MYLLILGLNHFFVHHKDVKMVLVLKEVSEKRRQDREKLELYTSLKSLF